MDLLPDELLWELILKPIILHGYKSFDEVYYGEKLNLMMNLNLIRN